MTAQIPDLSTMTEAELTARLAAGRTDTAETLPEV